MNPLLRSALLASLLLSTYASAEDSSPKASVSDAQAIQVEKPGPDVETGVDVEYIKRITVPRHISPPGHYTCDCAWAVTDRDMTPSWMLARMPVLVPDGTPQLVYRAPSAKQGSPDFGR